jgi:hypothetical protein
VSQVQLARADEADTVYGRFAGDLVFSAALGGGAAFLDPSSRDVVGVASAELRTRVVDTGGLVVAPEWRPEGMSRITLAADLRPLFLMRFVTNSESGERALDLFVDSIGLDLGVALTPLNDHLGAAFSLGFGFDVPVFSFDGDADGLFLRAQLRWCHAGVADQLGPPGALDDLAVTLLVGVRASASTGIASHEPPRYQLGD